MPDEVIEVGAPTLEQFMGYTEVDEHDRVIAEGQPDTALRAVMFTDIEGSTAISTSAGDNVAVELSNRHDRVVRAALEGCGGRIVKHTGDGMFVSFTSVLRAVEASEAIQRGTFGEQVEGPELAVKIGLTVGEPVRTATTCLAPRSTWQRGSVPTPPVGKRWYRAPFVNWRSARASTSSAGERSV